MSYRVTYRSFDGCGDCANFPSLDIAVNCYKSLLGAENVAFVSLTDSNGHSVAECETVN